jgi:hypothetical protein
MWSVLELEHHKDRMAMNCPEARAFRIHSVRKGSARVRVCPSISEHAIPAYVIYLIGAFCFSKYVGEIGVP